MQGDSYVHDSSATLAGVSHRVKRSLPAPPELDDALAESVAELSQAFATASRIRILVRLWRAPAAVTTVADDIGMEQSAVSHQLRLLRHLDLVRARRDGREIVYSLRDDHVAIMLDEAIYHVEHLRLGDGDAPVGARTAPGRPDGKTV
jgi:ArsR family transcriptional regulator, nickel/cobalt-responsive transcriptional repressor